MLPITRYSIQSDLLAPWINHIWSIQMVDADLRYKLLPTDCIDVLLNFGCTMVYESEQGKTAAPPLHINGLRSKPSIVHQKGRVLIWGVSFRPWGLAPFVRRSMTEIQEKIVNLEAFASPLAGRLQDAYQYHWAEDISLTIQEALSQEFLISPEQLEKVSIIREFMETDGEFTVQSFCEMRSIHVKTFERTFLYYTGYTPKALYERKRFQAAGNQLVHQHGSLSDIVYEHGFFDQAHFTKVFSRFSGASPKRFLSEKATVKENARYSYN